jgi:hypothetical protein
MAESIAGAQKTARGAGNDVISGKKSEGNAPEEFELCRSESAAKELPRFLLKRLGDSQNAKSKTRTD